MRLRQAVLLFVWGVMLASLPPGAQIYVGHASDNSIEKYSTRGVDLGVFVAAGSGGLNDPLGLAFGPTATFMWRAQPPAAHPPVVGTY